MVETAPAKSPPAKVEADAASTPEPASTVRLTLDGLPHMSSFTTSSGLVVTRDGVDVDGADVEGIQTEARAYGVVIREEVK